MRIERIARLWYILTVSSTVPYTYTAYNYLFENKQFYDPRTRIHLMLAPYELKLAYGVCYNKQEHIEQVERCEMLLEENTVSRDIFCCIIIRCIFIITDIFINR